MSNELKPCPFCGGEAGLSKGGRALCSNEGCIACDLFAPVEDWNRRAQPAEADGVEVVAAFVYDNDMLLCVEFDPKARMGAADGTALVRQSDHLAALSAVTAERDRLREALEECAASLAWNCFGECRAIHDGPIMPAAQALETAREALAAHRGGGDL